MKLLSAVAFTAPPWAHPWTTNARWNAKKEQWEAAVRPGLVNALPATVSLPREDFPRATVVRYAAQGKELPERLDVPLTDSPRLPLTSFRALGEDGSATPAAGGLLTFEAVPEFFRLLGVGPPPKIDLESLPTASLSTPLGTRLLRACDIVLHIDRPATVTRWSIGSGLEATRAQFALGVTTKPNARRSGYLTATADWTPIAERGNLLLGDVSDSPTDEYLVATVFLLSPPGAQLGSAPDNTWRPFSKHSLFWNLRHAMNKPAQLASQNLQLTTGLAGGVGDPLNALILSQVNDANSAAAQFLANGRLRSHAWTV